jgi:hypothetical protein
VIQPAAYRKTRETLPLEGGGRRGGERADEHSKKDSGTSLLPLTLTLSPKGRGEIIFDKTNRKWRVL